MISGASISTNLSTVREGLGAKNPSLRYARPDDSWLTRIRIRTRSRLSLELHDGVRLLSEVLLAEPAQSRAPASTSHGVIIR